MQLYRYFTSKPKIQGAHILNHLGVRAELRLLSLWKRVKDDLKSGNISDNTSKKALQIIKISLRNYKTITNEQLLDTLAFIRVHVIEKIGCAAADLDLVWLFDNKDPDTSELPDIEKIQEATEIQLSEYFHYCISEFGIGAINRLSISELAILNRLSAIKEGRKRLSELYDIAIGSNYSEKAFSSHTRSLRDMYRYRSLVEERILEEKRKEKAEKLKKYEGKTDEEINQMAHEQYLNIYVNSNN